MRISNEIVHSHYIQKPPAQLNKGEQVKEYFETERTIKQIFENMFIQHPKAKEMMFMYMHSDNKYDYFKDALTRKYIKAKK